MGLSFCTTPTRRLAAGREIDVSRYSVRTYGRGGGPALDVSRLVVRSYVDLVQQIPCQKYLGILTGFGVDGLPIYSIIRAITNAATLERTCYETDIWESQRQATWFGN
jgi:hypothetical protein